MRVYMDVCCLNRPFDDQYQDRIKIESEAILVILSHCSEGNLKLVGSSFIDIEISKMQDPYKKQKVSLLANLAVEKIRLNETIESRAIILNKNGISLFDSLHISAAEYAGVDVMLTTDDNLIRRSKRIKDIKVRIENPVHWLMEATDDEQDD